jgi:hypothetical protein
MFIDGVAADRTAAISGIILTMILPEGVNGSAVKLFQD